MTFSDRMKDILDQSKEFLSKAGEKAQDWGEKGFQASKNFVNKAGEKAQDLGEKSVIKLEIRQLESQAQKLIGKLGIEAYQAFVERGAKSVTIDTPAIKPILAEIASIREAIEKREAELNAGVGKIES
ncbi:hypothetical protein [Breznakiella homolactica]|uniref:Uncharacterized protein n=1 Tax=Breznakiella homolactica TaxID=2798577 RepID=A0A7T8BAZ4_9SPIR|nr:hypothetical protein [Breznakiella homolactica]QQO11269.1 hypothetical protein JFL75_10300 [Breznakiella homolactica]